MKFIRSILAALAFAVSTPAVAQLPAIDAVAGPSTSAQLRRILTDETGTGVAIFGGGDANTLINLNGSAVATGTVAAARLPNAGVTTVNGVSCTIGGICTITASAASMTVGVTDVLSGTSDGLLYNNAGDLGNLATANNGVLVTSAGGVPSISTTLPNGLAMGTPASLTLTNATGLPNAGLVNPSTTVNGQTCTLGSTCTVTAAASSLIPGTTSLTGGALNTNGLLFNSGNVLTNLASNNNGVLVTSAGGVPSISTTLPAVTANAPLVTATGTTAARSLANRFSDVLNAADFNVVCDDSTDNASTLAALFTAMENTGKSGVLPAGVCRFSTPLTVSAHGLSLTGAGKEATLLLYSGANQNPGSLLTFGTGSSIYQFLTLSGFSVGSATPLTSGNAVRIRLYNAVYLDLNVNGAGPYNANLWNGVYLDGATHVNFGSMRVATQNKNVLARSVVEVKMGQTQLTSVSNTSSVGMHVGGGVGGWYGEYAGQVVANVGLLVDTGLIHQSGTANTHGNTTLDNLTIDTSLVSVGWAVAGSGIPAGTTVAAVNSYNSITLSQAASGTATGVSVTISNYGGSADTHSNTTIDNISIGTATLFSDMAVLGSGIPAGTKIVQILGPNSVQISQAATSSLTGTQITFVPGNFQFFFGSSTWDTNRTKNVQFDDNVCNPIGKTISLDTGWFASATAGDGFVVTNFCQGSLTSAGATINNNSGHGLVLDDPTMNVRLGLATRVAGNGYGGTGYGVTGSSPISIYSDAIPTGNTTGSYGPNVSLAGVTGSGFKVLDTGPSLIGPVGITGITNMVQNRAAGGPLSFIDSGGSGKTYQVGQGAGTGASEWNIYNTTDGNLMMSLSNTGVVKAPAGFSANGSLGLSATKTVRDAAGTGTCTMVFTFGLLTGGTC